MADARHRPPESTRHVGVNSVKEADIWRTAEVLIREYGADAHEQAMMRARKSRNAEDTAGLKVWTQVAQAISILQAGNRH